MDWLTHDQFCASRWPNPFSELEPTIPRYQVFSSTMLCWKPRTGAGTTNRNTQRQIAMLATVVHWRRQTRYGSTAAGKTLIAAASANMLPAIQGFSCCSNQNPKSISARRTRFGCPRSNMSKTEVMVRTPGSANNSGPGRLPEPVIAFENCPVIHHATQFSSDRQV